EQARDEILEVRRDVDQQIGFVLGGQRLRRGARGEQPMAQVSVGLAEKTQEHLVEACETVPGVEVLERQIKAEFQHRWAEDHSGTARASLRRRARPKTRLARAIPG